MPASAFDSAIYRDLLGDADVARLFSDSSDIRALLLVEGALAKAQGALGLIPEVSAAAIDRAAKEAVIDPAALAKGAGDSAVPIPAFVTAFREQAGAPEHAQWIHWGATSQDIMDTGQMLRLKQVLAIAETRLIATLKALATLADTHAELPMAGRTYGQVATPTSFGAIAASWGRPLLRLLAELAALRETVLTVSLSGAAGTLSAMGPQAAEVRTRMAAELGLADPGSSWHSERDRITALAAWLTRLTTATGRIGDDLILLTQTGIAEVALAATGSSSTMPQKSNPVQPSVLGALARHALGLNTTIQSAALHRQQRDAAPWISEWLSLPQLCLAATKSLAICAEMIPGLSPRPEAMLAGIDDGLGLIYAEAISFELAKSMPRPEAQAAVKAMVKSATASGTALGELVASAHPGPDWQALCSPKGQLGLAPSEARAFAAEASAL